MQQQRPQRPSADITRQKILKAAAALFMEQGFHGTSMANLATKAGVNQTLIFHHFGDKKGLWRHVKDYILAQVHVTPISAKPASLEQLLTEIIDQSVAVHTQCPQLAKLVAWQRLESATELAGITSQHIGPTTWLAAFKYLQKQHLLNPKLKPELLMLWLAASIDVMMHDDLGLFKKNPQNKKYYVQMLMTSLVSGLV